MLQTIVQTPPGLNCSGGPAVRGLSVSDLSWVERSDKKRHFLPCAVSMGKPRRFCAALHRAQHSALHIGLFFAFIPSAARLFHLKE